MSNPMSSGSRRRPVTRNQWEEHFKIIHSGIMKRKNDTCPSNSKRATNESAAATPIHVAQMYRLSTDSDEVGRKRYRGRPPKQPLDERVDLETPTGSEILSKRWSDESVDVIHLTTSSEDEDYEALSSGEREYLSDREMKTTTSVKESVTWSSDDEVVVLKRPHSKVSNSDEEVGCAGGKRDGGRPRKKPLDECVDLETSAGSENLSQSCSDEAVDVIQVSDDDLTTSSEMEDEFSDEDYRASSSGEQEYLSDGNKTTTSCIHRKSEGVKERVREPKSDDEDDPDKERIVDVDADEFLGSRNSTRIQGDKESEVAQQRDYGVEKGCHAINDHSCPNKKRATLKSVDRVESDDDDDDVEFPIITKRARINPKNGEMAEKDEDIKICSGMTNNNNRKEDLSPAKCNEPSTVSNFKKHDEKSKSSRDEDSTDRVVGGRGPKFTKEQTKLSKQDNFQAKTLDLIKILVDSINLAKEHQSHYTAEESFSTRPMLPLRFGFEDEVPQPHVKSDWEKEIDSLFRDLEMGLLETEMDCTDSSAMENDVISSEIDQSPAACCARGDHHHILNEQIGIICKYCLTTILDIKYVLPQFYKPPPGRYDYRKDPDQSPLNHSIGPIQFHDSFGYSSPESSSRAQGTVWDLIPGVQKELYPHQREGFEFIWNNIAGDIVTEKMKFPLSGGRGCIISHAPGTGKTRLIIVFLQAFLKLYPTCHPVIIAPKGMLLTWESEFVKWKVNIPFHNLNKKELSENENSFAAEIFKQVISCGSRPMSVECMRLLKLASWVSGGGILGVSYQLFKSLVLENGQKGGGIKNQIKKLLLECPGILVLDEGHTPRNNKSKIWKALSKVATQRRIILSGTPFQNNLVELYNTLCIVNPKIMSGVKFANRTDHVETRGYESTKAGKKQWMNLTSSIGTEKNVGLKELRAMLDPFVHVHKGTILEESLPGLRDTLVFLHPTESQKALLEASRQTPCIFKRIQQVSLISVHPSLMWASGKSLPLKSKLEEIESVDEGVKTKFVIKLIQLADALGERVLVFSQYLIPLEFIKRQIKAQFSWNEGRELLYMDGQMDERQRQDSISSFNDGKSEAKVLLASGRACSEGINLVGASRVVLLETVWNPSVEKQAVSRAYRLGQKKVVYVYHLFTSGTEVRMYSKHIQKERISQLLFSPNVDGQIFRDEKSVEASEDKILEAMRDIERFSNIFEKIISQPKESDLIKIFGLVDQN